MTVPDPQAVRDAADRADTLRQNATPGPWRKVDADIEGNTPDEPHTVLGPFWSPSVEDAALIAATPELLSVLVPAARHLADLLDAIGDPESLRAHELDMSDGVVNTPEVTHDIVRDILLRIADAVAAARGTDPTGGQNDE